MELTEFEARLRSQAANLKTELQALRANRPSPKMVEDIKVEYYGQIMTVKQLGSIAVVPPREIHISVWDKAAVSAVAKAIEASQLNVPASVQGNTVMINLPQLTDERRKELEKVVRKIIEETRIKIRGARDEVNKEIKKVEEDKKLSEDAAFKKKSEVQKLVDRTNQDIEQLLDQKLKEISE